MTFETDAKMKDEFHAYQKKLGPLRQFSMVITSITMALAFFDKFPWMVIVDGNDKSLVLQNRLLFTLKLSFIDLLPLVIAILAVINRRISTIAINPMDPRGHVFVEQRQRILQNTLEQFIIKFSLSVILCTVLRSNELMIMPVFTFLFVLGRFTFVLGYPNYRSFGMAMNIVSAVFVIILIGYRLFIQGALFQHIKSGLGQLLAGQLLVGHLRADTCSLGRLLTRTFTRWDICSYGHLLDKDSCSSNNCSPDLCSQSDFAV